MIRPRSSLQWQLARGQEQEVVAGDWIAATVPGAVQLDWAKAHGLPDYEVGSQVLAWQGLDESHWIYRAVVGELSPLSIGQLRYLVLEGVDYACEVSIDGQRLHQQEGLQTPIELNVTACLRRESIIDVHVFPAPKSKPAPADRTQADHSCKPAVAYGWDFHPRLIPLGLWREAYLELRATTHFAAHPKIHYTLDRDCRKATGRLQVTLSQPATENLLVRWRLRAPDGVAETFAAELVITSGQSAGVLHFAFELSPDALWWPHDQGRPALHASEVELLTQQSGTLLDRDVRRVGFRTVRLVMAPNEWNEPSQFPKSRSRPPTTFEINGRPVFAKGSNWVCPDIFPGTLTADRYYELLALVHRSHFNFLRVWGGATAPHDWFYERCDELGIMVWQEFPLACNLYPDNNDYLAVLDQESRSLIRRLRGHASLVLWCGGNELFNAWSKMTDQSLPLRLLNRNCYELDPQRPYFPTAPIEGMGHGHYVFRDPDSGTEAWALFQSSRCTAYSEFGCPGPASVKTLRRILPTADLWPPKAGTAWETHHAFGSWQPGSWLHLRELEHYFGPVGSIEELVERGQLLQAIGFQGLFEEARRQKPTAGIALNWCLNEPWPTAANNSLISWPCEPKLALAYAAAACRPTLVSARIRKFSWTPGELFDAELWLLQDAPFGYTAVEVDVSIELESVSQHLMTWRTVEIMPGTNCVGPRIQFLLPKFEGRLFTLKLEVPDRPEWNSTYTLARSRSASESAPTGPTPVMNL